MKKITRFTAGAALCGLALGTGAGAGFGPLPALAVPPPGALAALNYSPTSRTLNPTAVYGTTGSV